MDEEHFDPAWDSIFPDAIQQLKEQFKAAGSSKPDKIDASNNKNKDQKSKASKPGRKRKPKKAEVDSKLIGVLNFLGGLYSNEGQPEQARVKTLFTSREHGTDLYECFGSMKLVHIHAV